MPSSFNLKSNNGSQLHDIRFSSDKARLEVYDTSSGNTVADFSLSSYLGMHVDSSNVLWVDDGITRNNAYITLQISSARIALVPAGNTFEFIGDDDTPFQMAFNGASGVSIRSDDPKMYFKG